VAGPPGPGVALLALVTLVPLTGVGAAIKYRQRLSAMNAKLASGRAVTTDIWFPTRYATAANAGYLNFARGAVRLAHGSAFATLKGHGCVAIDGHARIALGWWRLTRPRTSFEVRSKVDLRMTEHDLPLANRTSSQALNRGWLCPNAPTHRFQRMVLPVIDIDRLTVGERLELIEQVWDSLRRGAGVLPLRDAELDVIDARRAEHRADPDAAVAWESVRAELLSDQEADERRPRPVRG
jgi:putative addiction module component (TIGR02574 family)